MPNGVLQEKILGLASFYGDRDEHLYQASFNTYWTAHHEHKLEFIDVTCITELVMMAPDPRYAAVNKDYTAGDHWYMMKKPGAAFARYLS